MNKFAKQRNIIKNNDIENLMAKDEICKELCKEVRLCLFKMSKYKKYKDKRIGFISGMGVFYLYIDNYKECNHFNITNRIDDILNEFGYDAIPTGHIWVFGKEGGSNNIEGTLQ